MLMCYFLGNISYIPKISEKQHTILSLHHLVLEILEVLETSLKCEQDVTRT